MVAYFLELVADGKFTLIRSVMDTGIAGATGDLDGGSAVVVHLRTVHIYAFLLKIIKRTTNNLHKQSKKFSK